MTFELSPDEMKGTRFTLDTNLLIQASTLCSPPPLFTTAHSGAVCNAISIGAVYSLELWESGCLLSRDGLTKVVE